MGLWEGMLGGADHQPRLLTTPQTCRSCCCGFTRCGVGGSGQRRFLLAALSGEELPDLQAMGGAWRDVCAAEQDPTGWRWGSEGRGSPATPLLPQRPPPWSSEAASRRLAFGSLQCLGRRVSHRPLPESAAGLGYTDSAERNAITAGAEGGFKGLELSWSRRLGGSEPGRMGETQEEA